MLVTEGDTVDTGQKIAEIGNNPEGDPISVSNLSATIGVVTKKEENGQIFFEINDIPEDFKGSIALNYLIGSTSTSNSFTIGNEINPEGDAPFITTSLDAGFSNIDTFPYSEITGYENSSDSLNKYFSVSEIIFSILKFKLIG